MIFEDGVQLNLKEHDLYKEKVGYRDEHGNYVQGEYDRIGWPIKFRLKSRYKVYGIKTDGTTKLKPRPLWISTKVTVDTEFGSHELWYTKSRPAKKDGELQESADNTGFYHAEPMLYVSKDKAELAFFLEQYCPQVGVKGYFEMVDDDKDARDKLSSVSGSSSLDFFITSKYSPLHNDDDKVRMLGRAYGVSGSHDMSVERVKAMLLDKLSGMAASNSGIVDEFAKDVNGSGSLTVKNDIVKAEEDGHLIFNLGRKTWSFTNPKTGLPEKAFLNTQSGSLIEARGELVEYLSIDPDAKQILDQRNGKFYDVEGYDAEKHISKYTQEELDKLKRPQLVQLANRSDIKEPMKMKNNEIIAELSKLLK